MTDVVTADHDLRIDGPSAVTIGKFDGVHVGHQAVIDETVRSAGEIAGASVVISMWPHPATVLAPDVEIRLLTNLEDRIDLLALREPNYVRVEEFDVQFAVQRADDYVLLLRDTLGMKSLVLGADARLGRDRHAGIEEITEITRRLGVRLKVVDAVRSGGPVGSALVKRAYSEGDLAAAVKFLGRLPSYKGLVERGDGRGRDLGFPTANIAVSPELVLPAPGIYRGSAVIADDTGRGHLPAVINLGTRPTFHEGGDLVLEVHLLDFDEDVYGCKMRVFFEDSIRPEAKFSSEAELVDAIHDDIAAAVALPEKSDRLYEPWGGTVRT